MGELDTNERYSYSYNRFVAGQYFEQAEVANFTPAERRDYRESQKDFWDLFAVTETAEKKGEAKGRAEGLAEGKAKGRMEERYAIAANLKKLNVPLEAIAQASQLTIEEIENL